MGGGSCEDMADGKEGEGEKSEDEMGRWKLARLGVSEVLVR